MFVCFLFSVFVKKYKFISLMHLKLKFHDGYSTKCMTFGYMLDINFTPVS